MSPTHDRPLNLYTLRKLAVQRSTLNMQGRCAVVLMFRHQLAVLPAMAVGATLGDGLEELLKDVDEKEVIHPSQNGSRIVTPISAAASPPAASLGNSYVINLVTLGIREVAFAVRCKYAM